MTNEKEHGDLRTIEPLFRGAEAEEVDSSKKRDDIDPGRTIAEIDATPPTPPDPDEQERLLRG